MSREVNGLHPQGEYGSHDVNGGHCRSMVCVTGFSHPAMPGTPLLVSFFIFFLTYST